MKIIIGILFVIFILMVPTLSGIKTSNLKNINTIQQGLPDKLLSPCNDAPNTKGFIEVSFGISGNEGMNEKNIMLSNDEIVQLQVICSEIREGLETAKTYKQINLIIQKFLNKLDAYNLIPDDINTKILQKEIFSQILKPKIDNGIFGKEYNKDNKCRNLACLVVGQTSLTYFQPVIDCLRWLIFRGPFFEDLYELFSLLYNYKYSNINSCIILGGYSVKPFRIYPANGWMTTYGLLGHKSANGRIAGGNRPLTNILPPAVIGFTGIKIIMDGESETFYLGSALYVNIYEYGP